MGVEFDFERQNAAQFTIEVAYVGGPFTFAARNPTTQLCIGHWN